MTTEEQRVADKYLSWLTIRGDPHGGMYHAYGGPRFANEGKRGSPRLRSNALCGVALRGPASLTTAGERNTVPDRFDISDPRSCPTCVRLQRRKG